MFEIFKFPSLVLCWGFFNFSSNETHAQNSMNQDLHNQVEENNSIMLAIESPEAYKEATLQTSTPPHEEEEVILHLRQAADSKVNPVVLAIQQNDMGLAELLFMYRRIEISLGLHTFDFPGYRFNRPFGKLGEEAAVWIKRAPINIRNKYGEERCFSEAQVDVEILKLLMKHDECKLWTAEIKRIFNHAYLRCDLAGVLFCLQLAFGNPNVDIKQDISRPAYLIDPFLSNFAINLEDPNHFYNGYDNFQDMPRIWDYRPDDNEIVKEIKRQIQELVSHAHLFNGPKSNYQVEIEALKQQLDILNKQKQIDSTEFGQKLELHRKEINELQVKLELVENQKLEQAEEHATRLNDCRTELDALKKQFQEYESQKQNEIQKLRKIAGDLKLNQSETKDVERILIKYGNNPDGMSSLHYAIKKGDLSAVKLLIEVGADVNSQDWIFSTLTRAVSCNQFEIAKFLLDKGADANLKGANQIPMSGIYNAIYYAAKVGNADMIKLLVERGVDVNQNFNINPNYPNNDDPTSRLTPLHIAAKEGNYDAVVALVNLGARIDGQSKEVKELRCETPLDLAVINLKYANNPQNLDLIKFLVQNNAMRKNQTYYDHHCPVIKGYLQSVRR